MTDATRPALRFPLGDPGYPIEHHQGDNPMTDHNEPTTDPAHTGRHPKIEVFPYSTSDPNTTRPPLFGFRLKAENGEIVMHGEGYTRPAEAEAMARKIVIDHAYADARVLYVGIFGEVLREVWTPPTREHVTDGSRCWCVPQVVQVPAALPDVRDIIEAHIARLEAEAAAHRLRATVTQHPYVDPVFLGYATAAEGGVKALRAVLDEAAGHVTDVPVPATDGHQVNPGDGSAVPATEADL